MKRLIASITLELLAADIVYRLAIRPTVRKIVYR